MDEPLTHLDSTGRASVGKLLRKICNEDTLALSTILVILQDIAAEEIEECFDQVDEVVKSGGENAHTKVGPRNIQYSGNKKKNAKKHYEEAKAAALRA
eukprot:scaffold31778_cov58-Skeletonema_marinoi.AAC.1